MPFPSIRKHGSRSYQRINTTTAPTNTILRKLNHESMSFEGLTGHREKARIPAWCDRILRKGSNLKQIDYATAPLRFSDHRPVYATFDCAISNIDERRKEELSRALYERRKRDIEKPDASSDKTGEDLAGYSSIAAGLPPASSDRRKWWLDNGMVANKIGLEINTDVTDSGLPARSQVRPPQNNMVLNAARPSNPFTPTNELDWVMVDRSLEAGKSTSGSSPPPILPPIRRGTRMTPPSNGLTGVSSNARILSGSSDVSSSKASTSPLSPLDSPDVKRKPAPPVPKKPPVLSRHIAGPGSPDGRTAVVVPNSRGDEGPKSNQSVTTVFPPPPRQTDSGRKVPETGTASHPAKVSPNTRRVSDQQGRPLPSALNPPAVSSSRREGSGISPQNILDEDDEGASVIPSLQPSRPR